MENSFYGSSAADGILKANGPFRIALTSTGIYISTPDQTGSISVPDTAVPEPIPAPEDTPPNILPPSE